MKLTSYIACVQLSVLGVAGGMPAAIAQSANVDRHHWLSRQLQLSDRELNSAYSRRLGQLSPIGRSNLRSSQRVWLSQRNAECDVRASDDLSLISDEDTVDCLVRMTADRLNWLSGQTR